MNLFNVANIMQTLNLSLSERAMKSAEVVLTGFVVVFAVLLSLILIIKIYSLIITKATQSGQSNKKVNKISNENPLPVPTIPIQEQDGVSEEVVAVISAAVATMYGPQTKTRIKSIKKSNTGRNAWANVGVIENTRPF